MGGPHLLFSFTSRHRGKRIKARLYLGSAGNIGTVETTFIARNSGGDHILRDDSLSTKINRVRHFVTRCTKKLLHVLHLRANPCHSYAKGSQKRVRSTRYSEIAMTIVIINLVLLVCSFARITLAERVTVEICAKGY